MHMHMHTCAYTGESLLEQGKVHKMAFRNISLIHTVGSTTHRRDIEDIMHQYAFGSVLVLATEGDDHAASDSRALTSLLLVRDIREEMREAIKTSLDDDDATEISSDFTLLGEILDAETKVRPRSCIGSGLGPQSGLGTALPQTRSLSYLTLSSLPSPRASIDSTVLASSHSPLHTRPSTLSSPDSLLSRLTSLLPSLPLTLAPPSHSPSLFFALCYRHTIDLSTFLCAPLTPLSHPDPTSSPFLSC